MYLERGRDLLEVRRRVLSAAEIREAPDGVAGHGHAAGLGEHGQQRRENALEWDTVQRFSSGQSQGFENNFFESSHG